MLVKTHTLYNGIHYYYAIRQLYARGIDSYGWNYVCNEEDFIPLKRTLVTLVMR